MEERVTGKDGKEMILIPAGEFLMGEGKTPTHVDAFYIDRYLVTNADYKQFIDATGYGAPPHWRGLREPPADKLDHPVVQVTYSDAEAYAKWAGKRLPTRPEWEKAARGLDGWVYPWGDDFDKNKCNTSESGIFATTPVGKYSPDGDSPYGLADMAGNVYEWTNDGTVVTTMGLRGGSWLDPKKVAQTFNVRKHTPRRKNDQVGFRCAMDVGG